MEKQTFRNWMKSTYDREELADIARYGCQSGVSCMIYYHETSALYDLHADELHDMLSDYEEQTGFIPDYIIDRLGDLLAFKNAVVWFCAEVLAQEMIGEDEIEEA